ncbi:unnamed protein product [Rhizophagus irregularis]|nr:unnamed protein product [Rhizophagus irregularis]CAB4432663.1 unnamed protein product [Rhizophagus irregularis]
MPKIVSSSTVSSSEQLVANPEQHLHVYYCLCKVYKLNAVEAPNPVILKRSDGYEKQYKLHCPRCNLFLAYEVTEKRKSGPYTYIVEGSLTENQGVVPHDAISK